ncbi:MAG: transposase [Edaphocola sp.]
MFKKIVVFPNGFAMVRQQRTQNLGFGTTVSKTAWCCELTKFFANRCRNVQLRRNSALLQNCSCRVKSFFVSRFGVIKTFDNHLTGIFNAVTNQTSSAKHENMNGKTQAVIAKARGFLNIEKETFVGLDNPVSTKPKQYKIGYRIGNKGGYACFSSLLARQYCFFVRPCCANDRYK